MKNAIRILLALALSVSIISCDRKHEPQRPESPLPTEGLRVSADFYGDYYGTGYNNFIMLFQIGEVDKDGYFINGGEEVSLDILTSSGSLTSFPEGRYTITNTDYNSAGIVPSTLDVDGGQRCATYSYLEQDANNHWLDPLSSACLNVKVNGAQYDIILDFSVGKDNFRYVYSGPLTIYDRTSEGDLEFSAHHLFTDNYGPAWNDTTDDWFIYCMSEDENEYVCLELVSAKGTKPAAGTYSVPSNFYDTETIYPLTLCPIYEYEGEFGGTCYVKDGKIWYAASEGTCKLSHSMFTTTIELEFYDSEYDATVTMKYSGPITWSAPSALRTKSGATIDKAKTAKSIEAVKALKLSRKSACRLR